MTREPSILCDMNVWLDYYLGFRSGHEAAQALVIRACEVGANLLVPFGALKDLYYIIQLELKRVARQEGRAVDEKLAAAIRGVAWAALENLDQIATVVGGDGSDVCLATKQRRLHDDFEDDLVIAAAMRSGADYLVTSDVRLIQHAPVAALSPEDALAVLE